MSWQTSDSVRLEGVLDVQELYRDLERKYRNIGSKVDTIWRNFTPKQREIAMRESTGDGIVLRHSRDPGLGGLARYIPEYNLRDMKSKPEHFLDIFKFRALTPLIHQLYQGVNGGPGDREMWEKSGTRHRLGNENERTIFMEGPLYGKTLEATAGGHFPMLSSTQANSVLIPGTVGRPVLMRQQYLFQFLNHIIEEILDLDSETRQKQAPKRNVDKALATAASQLYIQPKPLKCSLPEVRSQAMESKTALEDHLFLLCAEPVLLNQAVNTAYWSRAELVPDDRGRILPVITDRYLSAAFFDVVTTAVTTITIWDYILRLLELLEIASDKVEKGIIVQELSNTCHLEFRRAQNALKRNVAPQGHVAGKAFKRMTDTSSGQSKIAMNRKPGEYTVADPQLHYILQLCHPDTSPATASQWIQKIDDHNARYNDDRKKLTEPEVAALGDLAIIVSFMHATSTAMSMVPVSRKSGVLFTARFTELETELNNIKLTADFGD